MFVADDAGAWLVGLLADAGRRRLTTLVLGTDQERALRRVAGTAVQRTAAELRPGDGQRADELAMIISEVFGIAMPDALPAGRPTLLDALQAGIATQLASLGDPSLTDTGRSSADVLGISVTVLAEKLTSHIVREIVVRGAGGGPLQPLAAQLNHDVTHLQGQRLEAMFGQLASEIQEALGSSAKASAVGRATERSGDQLDGRKRGGGTGTGSVRVFISYAVADTGWADWVAWQLDQAGYEVDLDAWDRPAGDGAAVRVVTEAVDRAAVVVALWSAAYFEGGQFTGDERQPLVADRGLGQAGGKRLVPVWVADPVGVAVPAALRHLTAVRLDRLDGAAMEQALLSAVAGPPRPIAARSQPMVWNVPLRSTRFTGREMFLAMVRERLLSGDRTVVQALHGMGGVGKTLLAVEYAHRFAREYDLVWWVDAEQPGLILEEIGSLAVAVGLVPADTAIPVAVAAAKEHLRSSDRWLIVFDNAEDPAVIRRFLPEGPGHVLITSRNPSWSGLAIPVEIDVFTRAESVHLLMEQSATLTEQDADAIAAQLGDLPLAIAQAAGVLADTYMSADEYLNALREETEHVLDTGVPATYSVSLAAVVRIATKKVAAVDPAAAQLLKVCAFLAPEPVDAAWFASTASLNQRDLPDPLAALTASSFALRQRVALLARHGLARATRDGLLLHRLIAAITCHALTPAEQGATRATAEQLLVAAGPADAYDPATWPAWTAMLPHLIHLDPATTSNDGLRELACTAALVMYLRGDSRGGGDLAQHLYRAWSTSLGKDHPNTLYAANNLARCSHGLGDYEHARLLDQDTFNRRRRVLGEDHEYTLYSASNLARDLQSLKEYGAARALEEDTFARRRRVLGDDHRDTLHSANRLAIILHDLKDYQGARKLQEDTLTRSRQVLGEDHPDALSSASRLATTLHSLRDYQAARELQEDTLARMRRVLSEDHPNTLRLASDLAVTLHSLGDFQGARALQEDTLARMRRVLGNDHPDTKKSSDRLTSSTSRYAQDQTKR